MNREILAQLSAAEPIELTQQLIRIPSFLWHESEYWFLDRRSDVRPWV